ncbi:hypothetical protein [Streptomyces lavendulocolor]|uniref:hypothetical protein n=1 Tax=Streptomyces lavendulocolor TaxID=67316 RepID=UPI003C2B36C7
MTRTTRLLAAGVIAAAVAAGTTATATAAGHPGSTAAAADRAVQGVMTTQGDNHLPAPPQG